MKYLFIIIAFTFISITSFAQLKYPGIYSIKGRIDNWNGKYIFFSCRGIGKSREWDSTIVRNNVFSFSGKLLEPANGFITTRSLDRFKSLDDSAITERFFIGPSYMSISLSLNNFHQSRLKGSPYQDEYYSLQAAKRKWDDLATQSSLLYNNLNKEYTKALEKSPDSVYTLSLAKQLDSLSTIASSYSEKSDSIKNIFFKQRPNSYITAFLLEEYYRLFSLSLKELQWYYNRMNQTAKKWAYGIKLKNAITNLQKGSPGAMATNFSAKDINGDSISLLQFRGKYVLLDFWASWCVPCRAGNPELIRLYQQYKNKGIEFIGLAADIGTEDKWKAAVAKDGIQIWKQVLDKKIGDKYAVHTIPLQILIDPNGIIIGRYGDGGAPHENLEKNLESIFNK
jgi:thiol-disulfide isomerase/thioredoxin